MQNSLDTSTDGSFETTGWYMLAASSATIFTIWSAFAGLGVFLPVLEQNFGWTRAELSAAFSLSLPIGGICGLAFGRVADRHGPSVLLVGSAIVGASFVWASSMNSLWQWQAFVGLGLGIGMAGFYPVLTATVVRWFHKGRGLALGILLTSHGLGYLLGPLIAVSAIGAFGWSSAYSAIGILVLVLAGPLAALLRFPSPAVSGLRAPRGGQGRECVADSSAAQDDHLGESIGKTVRSTVFWIICVTWFFLGFAQTMVSVHLVAFVHDKGIGLVLAAGALSLLGLGSTVGRGAIGWLSDVRGTLWTFRLCGTLGVISLAGLVIMSDYWALYVAAGLFGFASAGADTVTNKATSEAFRTRSLATALSAVNLGRSLGAGLGPAWAGLAFDYTRSYWLPFGTSALGLVVVLCLFGIVTRARLHEPAQYSLAPVRED